LADRTDSGSGSVGPCLGKVAASAVRYVKANSSEAALDVKCKADFDTEDPKKDLDCGETANDSAVGGDVQGSLMHDLIDPTTCSPPVAGTSASNAPDQTILSQQLANDGFPGRAHTMPA
jgi:hypothetical protein